MIIEFWDNLTHDIDLNALRSSAVSVKGTSYRDPCRFLEIYGNSSPHPNGFQKSFPVVDYLDEEIKDTFIPKIPNVKVELGESIYQAPFVWNDCHPDALAINFTYNTNAIYRIIYNLSVTGKIPRKEIDNLVDRACILLSAIYKSNGFQIVRCTNNNINMFIVSKVIEVITGKSVYNCDQQEAEATTNALFMALEMAKEHASLQPKEQMGLALGKGIAFLEKHSIARILPRDIAQGISETMFKYTEGQIAIDDRQKLIDMVGEADDKAEEILMCAILDDTAESIDDLLWMQSLMIRYPRFRVNLLVNRAQVSINFSAAMLDSVLASSHFIGLKERLTRQLIVTMTYCPLISFQTNLLPCEAMEAIREADFVYVKGLNFFETCQLVDKDTFYAFVVYGPISRLYTGFDELDGIFAFLPAGFRGYIHNSNWAKIVTLRQINRKLNLERWQSPIIEFQSATQGNARWSRDTQLRRGERFEYCKKNFK
jgi:hypothetical protein